MKQKNQLGCGALRIMFSVFGLFRLIIQNWLAALPTCPIIFFKIFFGKSDFNCNSKSSLSSCMIDSLCFERKIEALRVDLGTVGDDDLTPILGSLQFLLPCFISNYLSFFIACFM